MSSSRVDQPISHNEPDGEPFGSRRGSLVVNLFSKGHQRSSVTTTTSTTKRWPIRALAKSLGGSFASGSSPPDSAGSETCQSRLDDLRECLAKADDARIIFASHCGPPKSQPASTTRLPSSENSHETNNENNNRHFVSDDKPSSAPATLSHSSRHRLVVDEDEDDEDCREEGHQFKTTNATIKLARDSARLYDNERLTSNTNEPSPSRQSCNLIQVVEIKEDSQVDQEEEDQDNTETKPIVEVKQTSSSGSSSSSAVSSPVSSRQSSDCERRVGIVRRTSNNNSNNHNKPSIQTYPDASCQQQQPSATVSSSSSSSLSSESSSRKLIRRRTVRRSYHHRALEESAEPLVVTTKTSTLAGDAPNRCRSAEPEVENQAEASSIGKHSNHLSPLATNNNSSTSTKIQSSSKLSTSRSSSKIATITTSSSTTNHHHLKKCSTTSKQTINKSQSQQQQQQQEAMTATSGRKMSGSKLDLSTSNLLDSQQHQQQQSLFERRNRSSMMAGSDMARAGSRLQGVSAAACMALEKEEARSSSSTSSSSLLRKSSEQSSTSSTSFNASSSLTKSTKLHHRHLATGLAETVAGSAMPANGSAISSSASSSCETSLSRSATKKIFSTAAAANGGGHREICQQQQADLSSSSLFRTSSSSVFLSAATAAANKQRKPFLDSPDNMLLSSPDVRSLAQQLGSDFAELESAMTASSGLTVREQLATRSTNELTSRLFGSLAPPPSSSARLTYRIEAPPSPRNEPDSLELLMNETSSTIRQLEDNPPAADLEASTKATQLSELAGNSLSSQSASCNGTKIRELMDKAQRHRLDSGTGETLDTSSGTSLTSDQPIRRSELETLACNYQPTNTANNSTRTSLNENEAVKGKIERIDQRMNDLCRKLEGCNDTQKAIELLKIMIQTIEKAWSIPVCGDDLGFKLCSSLRQFGGLDMILGFIHEADARLLLQTANKTTTSESLDTPPTATATAQATASQTDHSGPNQNKSQLRPAKQLKLNLSKIQQSQEEDASHQTMAAIGSEQQVKLDEGSKILVDADHNQEGAHQPTTKEDEDSDILTSDLGLDSTTSVESLSFVSARAGPTGITSSSQPVSATSPTAAMQTPPASDDSITGSCEHEELAMPSNKLNTDDMEQKQHNELMPACKEAQEAPQPGATLITADDEAELKRVREEELVLLSAHLLSQCLTSENRDYIVRSGLDPVIKLACQFTTMKSKHSKRLLKRSALIRQSSTMKQQQQQQLQLQLAGKSSTNSTTNEQSNEADDQSTVISPERANNSIATCGDQKAHNDTNTATNNESPPAGVSTTGEQHDFSDDMHSAIGTEILQHLFKHSEETCSRMITLGALQAILYGCRSSHVETLRHCASALANLALYGGSDSQQTMVEQKAHVWLFPLAFNEDDNVQYYACLAIVVLAANQEIEADVLKSSTLDLVEPFVTSHEPRRFAESTTSHIHGQSAAWLRKLMPLLESKREEARNLACFHFAMEAHIKREQGQTQLFKEIGSIEPLRRAGSSPIAIASKFACQALRLIGEQEPHKLSQQVPLWTCEDVCEWVSQIGFDRFKPAFRESHVDGDLLLQLDEEMLKFDIGIENGIIRRRFLRELSNLKRIADYSSVDKSNLGQLLISSTSLMSPTCGSVLTSHHNQLGDGSSPQMLTHAGTATGSGHARSARDYLQYIYPIIQLGVTRDNIHLVDCDQLLAECKITNALHRIKLAHSIRELQDRVSQAVTNERNSFGCGAEQKTLDVFVSYRRSTGSQLASLLKVHLQLRGFSVFIDVERLEAGKFDNNLLESIRLAKNFILVLSPSALDRCIGDHECKDWVHKEILAALASNCNIIPIIDNNFHWPDPEQLPEDMRSVSYFNGIRWIHDYQDACVDKVERFIRGELSNSSASQTTTAGCPSTISIGSGGGGSIGPSGPAGSVASQYQRLGYSGQNANVSTPSIVASTPSLCGPQNGVGGNHHSLLSSSQPVSSMPSTTANKPLHDHQQTAPASGPMDSTQHPLANYANPYLNCSLNCGNVNPNIRLR